LIGTVPSYLFLNQ